MHDKAVGTIGTDRPWDARLVEQMSGGKRERTRSADWPSPTPRSREWTVRYALIAYIFAMFVVLAPWGGSFPRGVATLVADGVLLIALLPLYRLRSVTLGDLGVRRAPGARSVGFAVLAFVAIVLIDVAVAAGFTEHGTAGSTFFELSHQSVLIKVLAGFAAAVSAPVVEEIFFRGVLYRSLRNRLPVLAAALIAGTMFGLAHAGSYPLGTLPGKAGFGFVMCLLYERTGSLLPCIAVHSFIDGSVFQVELTGNNWVVLGVFALLAGVLLARPPLKRLTRAIGSATRGLQRRRVQERSLAVRTADRS
jgi:membrane protease YdiL (CAAX protease family)